MPHSARSLPPRKRHSRLTAVRRGCKRSRIAGIHGEAMYTAPDYPQGVCSIRKAAEPPTAAQQRMIGAEANRIAASNAATPRAGSSIGKRCSSSSCPLAMQTPFFWTVTPPIFFPGKENGGVWCCGAHAAFPPPPETGGDISAPFGAEKGGTFDVFHRT